MADNALERLFEEISLAAIEVQACIDETAEIDRLRILANERADAARKRTALLDDTLNRHIHDGLPVLQAKMLAQEEANDPARIANDAYEQAVCARRKHLLRTYRVVRTF